MKPYFETELGKLYNCDCLNFMQTLEDKSIDLVLTDPPYGIGADNMQMGSGEHNWDKTERWDAKIPEKNMFLEQQRISNNQIIWGGNYFTQHLMPSANWLIWDKNNPNMSFSEAEIAWVNKGKRIRIFKYYSALIKKQHPTQKPTELMVWCLDNYSKCGDIVFDGYLGSGTTAVACEQLNRRWIGCEISEKYCKIAAKRIQAEYNQVKMAL